MVKCSVQPDRQTNENRLNWMDPSQCSQYQQLEAVEGQRSGYRLDKRVFLARWHRRALAEPGPGHSPSAFGISPEMEWSIGWWTCSRADSRHLRSPDWWLLPQLISELVWTASWAQETQGSPHCCFSSRVTRNKHTELTTLQSLWLWK